MGKVHSNKCKMRAKMELETKSSASREDRVLPAPMSNRDFDFFYEGLALGELRVQKCGDCSMVRNPPGPMCPHCRSLKWTALKCSGTGKVFSFTTHHHPPLANFVMPHTIILADMAEGFRLVGGLPGVDSPGIQIGMSVRVQFVRRGDVATFHFLPDANVTASATRASASAAV
jgi:uncharacterized protein